MSFKPLHSLIDQQPQHSVVISGNRRIAPAISKSGHGTTASLPGSSPASFKTEQKIQLGSGEVLNLSDLQGLLKGNAQGTNIVDLSAITPSQTNSHFVKKNGPQQGNLAKRIQVKQQPQQVQQQSLFQIKQRPSNVLPTIVVQNQNSSTPSFQDGPTSAFITDQKPFALQIAEDAPNQNSGNISFVTVVESEESPGGAPVLTGAGVGPRDQVVVGGPGMGPRDQVILQTDSNGILLHDPSASSELRNSTLVIDNSSTNQSFGQIILRQNEANDTAVSQQPLFMNASGGGGGGGGDPFGMNVFDVLGEEIEGTGDNTFQHSDLTSSLSNIASDKDATTTVLIPSSTPGMEPQRLVIPTSTLLQITGQSTTPVSPPSSSLSIRGAVGDTPTHQRLKSTSGHSFSTGFVDNVPPFVLSPSKNPSNYVLLPKPSLTTAHGNRYVPITAAPTHSMDNSRTQDSFELNGSTSPLKDSTQRFTTSPVGPSVPTEAGPNRNRKPCNCTKSQCLKLYCDCFANGEFCFFCNCNGCMNNMENEEVRQKSIKQCLDRNPYAFHPKIGKSKANGSETRRHAKGCNCKKSGCLKNYCECYEAKIPCTSHCKCVGCKNFDENDEEDRPLTTTATSTASSTTPAASGSVIVSRDSGPVQAIPASRFLPQVPKSEGPLDSVPSRPRPFAENGQRQPFSLITREVVEATTQCMLASSRKIENRRNTSSSSSSHHSSSHPHLDEDEEDMEVEMEAAVIEELGRCLKQIITAANKTLAPPAANSHPT